MTDPVPDSSKHYEDREGYFPVKLHTGINYNAVLEHTVSRIEEMGRLFKERAEAQQG